MASNPAASGTSQQAPFPPQPKDLITLQVRGERFTILTSTLTAGSKVWEARLNGPTAGAMAPPPRTDDGTYLIEADPEVFKHILSFWETCTYPFLWESEAGFDHVKYAKILQMANYLGVDDLAKGISLRKYEAVVKTVLYEEVEDSDDLVHRDRQTLKPKSTAMGEGSTILEMKTHASIDEVFKCPSGHVNDGRCPSKWNCWKDTPVTTLKMQQLKLVKLWKTTTFRWEHLIA